MRRVTCLNFLILSLVTISFTDSQAANAQNTQHPKSTSVAIGRSNFSQDVQKSSAENTLRELEQKVEAAIVSGDTEFLRSVYTDDFQYSRTNGQVDNKTQWLKAVMQRPFVSRKIVSLDVEIHGDVAVTYGQLDMTVRDERGEHGNLLKYLRVYELRNGSWQMLMHRSLDETTTVKTHS